MNSPVLEVYNISQPFLMEDKIMKLNPDYVRDILFYIEENVNYNTETIPPKHNELWFGKIYEDKYFENHDK